MYPVLALSYDRGRIDRPESHESGHAAVEEGQGIRPARVRVHAQKMETRIPQPLMVVSTGLMCRRCQIDPVSAFDYAKCEVGTDTSMGAGALAQSCWYDGRSPDTKVSRMAVQHKRREWWGRADAKDDAGDRHAP